MSSPIRCSILIPCYNAQKWIRQCIESALNQTVAGKEVIVIDDGSTDDSCEIIRSFGSRIRFEFGPNRGGNVARNQLLELATGEWVQFLDADDYLKPEKIERQLQSTTGAGSVDIIYSPVTCETWKADEISDTREIEINSNQSLEEQWIRWRVAQTGSVLWRRKSLQHIGGWNEDFPCCQDNEVTLRAIQNGLRFYYCSSADAVYRIWSEDTVCRKDPHKVIRYRTDLIRQMLAWLDSRGELSQAHQDASGQAFFEMARTMAKSDIVAANKYAAKCKQDRLFKIDGPAAPRIYRLLYPILGFARTEKLAAVRR